MSSELEHGAGWIDWLWKALSARDWVIDEACATLAQLRDQLDGASGLTMSVNLSARQLGEPDLVPTIEAAIRGYKEINLRAMQLLNPGGYLITASCTYHVPEDAFEQMLDSAAADAKRRIQIVEKRGAGKDHPVLLGLRETSYLKCFVLRAS